MATGKTLITLEGHQDNVDAAVFSPDGTKIVTGSSDGTARVWDVATGKTLITLEGHEDRVVAAGFSPDGAMIVTGSWDKTVRVWDVATGTTLQTMKGHNGGVFAAAFSPEGTRIVTASEDASIRVWDVATSTTILTLNGQLEPFAAAAFSPDGKYIVAGSGDKSVWVWDVGAVKRDLQYALIQLAGFEQLSEEQRRRFLIFRPELFEPSLIADISAARRMNTVMHWQIELLDANSIDPILTSWREAAAQGLPEAHEALSDVLLTGRAGIAKDIEAALFHAAIATRLYEALGYKESAAAIRIRRANLARTLPVEKVASLWPRIRDWRPQEAN